MTMRSLSISATGKGSPHPGSIQGHQHSAVYQIASGIDEPCHLLLAQHGWQRSLALRKRNMLVKVRTPEGSSHRGSEEQRSYPQSFSPTASGPGKDAPDTAGCAPEQGGMGIGQSTWRSLLWRGCSCVQCCERSCGARVHPASSGVIGSQVPPCDPF